MRRIAFRRFVLPLLIVAVISVAALIISSISIGQLYNGFNTKRATIGDLTITGTLTYMDPSSVMEFVASEPVKKGDFVSIKNNGEIVKGYDILPWLELSVDGDLVPLADGAFGQLGDSLYLLGGSLNGFGTATNDVYQLNLRTQIMTKLNTTGQGPNSAVLFNPYSVADKQRNSIWMYGGWDGSGGTPADFSSTLFQFNIETNTWTNYTSTPVIPGTRTGGELVVMGDYIYLYGGFDTTLFYDGTMFRTDANNPGNWTVVTPVGASPGPRTDYVWLSYKDKSIFFGGAPSGSSVRNDVWQFDPVTAEWTELVANNILNISPRTQVGGKGVILDDYLYVYGGAAGSAVFDDLWAFDLINLRWNRLSATGVKPLYRNYIGIIPSTREIAIFGGFTGINTGNSDSLFKFVLPRKPVGVVCNVDGSSVTVQTIGIVQNVYSDLNPGLSVFVTDTGNLTQLAFQPFGYRVGLALSNDTILLTP